MADKRGKLTFITGNVFFSTQVEDEHDADCPRYDILDIMAAPTSVLIVADEIVKTLGRGIDVVVKANSRLLLTRLLTFVARGAIPHEDVTLYCVDDPGTVASTGVDRAGRYEDSDWPDALADIELRVECEYIRAAQAVLGAEAEGENG